MADPAGYTELVAQLRAGNHPPCMMRITDRGAYVHRNADGTLSPLRGCDLCEERSAAADAIETLQRRLDEYEDDGEVNWDNLRPATGAEVTLSNGEVWSNPDVPAGFDFGTRIEARQDAAGDIVAIDCVTSDGKRWPLAIADHLRALGIGETKETP